LCFDELKIVLIIEINEMGTFREVLYASRLDNPNDGIILNLIFF